MAEEYEIIALIRKQSKKKCLLQKYGKIKFIELNMEDYHDLSNIVKEKIDGFIHLSWSGTRGEDRNDSLKQTNNYLFSMDAVKEAVRLGSKKIISAGSQAEYGVYDEIITETTPCKPITRYGIEKLRFYHDAYELCMKNNVSFKEPRFFSLYGPDDFEGTMIIDILKKMIVHESCDLTLCVQKWDFLHIDDAIRGVVALLKMECEDGAYNFGSGDTRTLKEFVEQMKRITRSNSRLNYGAVPYPKTGMVTIQPDNRKLMHQTGWKPQISFEEGILDIIRKLKEEM